MSPGCRSGGDEVLGSLTPLEDRSWKPIRQIRMPPASCTTGREMPKRRKMELPTSNDPTQIMKQYSAMREEAAFLARVSRPDRKGSISRAVPIGLTGGQFNVLMSLDQAGPLTVSELARHVGADPTTIPRALRPLKEGRLVTSRPGRDRREHVIAVTPLGRRRVALARRRWTVVQRRILDAIGHPAWIALTRSLGTIRHAARAGERATAA